MAKELPIIQKTYDLIKWYVPLLNRLPKDHKFQLGERMVSGLYDLLEKLVLRGYPSETLPASHLLICTLVRSTIL